MHGDNQLVAVGCWDAVIKLYDIFNKERKAVRVSLMSLDLT
jgi:hypothetical protein